VCLVTGSTAGIGPRDRADCSQRRALASSPPAGGDAPQVGEVLHVTADLSLPASRNASWPPRWTASAGSTASSTTSAPRGRRGFEEVPDDEWDAYWQLNLMSHLRAIRAALPAFRERGAGGS
jgi:NAD(P)-dependent dehydrogenase (short-subunit alcohol dehydrogenase family)